MHKIYTSPDRLTVFHFKNILESYHIDCVIKNEFLAGAAGELPPNECWPELWVKHANEYSKALEILEKNRVGNTATPLTWTCTIKIVTCMHPVPESIKVLIKRFLKLFNFLHVIIVKVSFTNPDCNGFWGEHIGSPLQIPNSVGVDISVNPC